MWERYNSDEDTENSQKCRDAYLGVYNESDEPEKNIYIDPYVSPMYATNEMLSGLPGIIYIAVAEFDPLSDEAIVFAGDHCHDVYDVSWCNDDMILNIF